MSQLRTRYVVALLVLVALTALAAVQPWSRPARARSVAACTTTRPDGDAEEIPGEEREGRRESEAPSERRDTTTSPAGGLYAGPGEADAGEEGEAPCGHRRPESFADLARANSARLAHDVAPGTQLRPGAYRAAVAQRTELSTPAARASVAGASGRWSPYGNAPVETGRADYDTTNGSTQEGLGNVAGRVSSIVRNTASGALYAASANGGVFRSTDEAATWSSISDTLPTQVLASVAWSPAGGGSLLALTGDNAFGGSSLAGLGVYRSTDEGRSWTHAVGVPDGILGFKLAVDPVHPERVYAATGAGLFVSTDAGASFANANLPTGKNAPAGTPDCSGKPSTAKDCFLANMVTDVVVQGPANAKSNGGTPGAVVAAVGWRAGQKKNADGSQQSPGNGVYRSTSGAPNSFTDLDIASHVTVPGTDPLTKPQIGRFALGAAEGETQNHQALYAIVSDAVKFNGGAAGLDVNDQTGQGIPNSDVLNGVYVSTDFGTSWKQLEGSSAIDSDPSSGSALAPPTCKAPVIGYCPGVQGWYNLWVQPDPSKQDASGVPSRLAFGLEEVWMNDQTAATPLDGSVPQKFNVIGRYFAGSTCTLLTATNALPVCPAAPQGVPKTTTHPDQHAALFVPDGKGGVTLYAGNDGGIYKQHVDGSTPFDNQHWGTGVNSGMHTTLPYDAAMAKDGTTYAGLQDNGEMKIDPDGRAYTVFGGDGFFSAVDPDNADVAYEEYTGGGVSVTKDGGKTWDSIDPGLTSPQFSTPFEMDPADANHLIIGGRDIQERLGGPDGAWKPVFDLGTQKKPGVAAASASSDGPDNQLSAVDVRSYGEGTTSSTPAGPKTADVTYTGSAGLSDPTGSDVPGSYDDHPVTIAGGAGNATMKVDVDWDLSADDFDLVVFRKAADGSLTEVGSSAQGGTTNERVTIPAPQAGDYVVRVRTFAAIPTDEFRVKVAFTQAAAGSSSTKRSAAYVGYCGYCDTITQGTPFANGVATNVTGGQGGTAGDAKGWHIAAARGLPSRLITSVRIDPADVGTVYVTLAGYGRRWAFPGAVGEDTSKVGVGHVFKSTDGAESFTDISGNLPDIPANWSVVHKGQLIVGTDLGVFAGNDTSGCTYAAMNGNLPTAPIASLRLKPGDPDLLVAASYGRGVYTYRFPADAGPSACTGPDLQNTTPAAGSPTSGVASTGSAGGTKATGGTGGGAAGTTNGTNGSACVTDDGFRSVRVSPRGRGLRFTVARRIKQPFTVSIFQQAQGRRTVAERLVKRFSGQTHSFTWSGGRSAQGRPLTSGYYFARLTMSGPGVRDTRRVALSGGASGFRVRRDFAARASCRLLRTAKLNGPTWGGSRRTPLGIAFRLRQPGSVTVTVRRGTTVIKTVRYAAAGTSTHRYRLSSRGRRAGDYSVTIAAASGGSSEKVALVSRRLR